MWGEISMEVHVVHDREVELRQKSTRADAHADLPKVVIRHYATASPLVETECPGDINWDKSEVSERRVGSEAINVIPPRDQHHVVLFAQTASDFIPRGVFGALPLLDLVAHKQNCLAAVQANIGFGMHPFNLTESESHMPTPSTESLSGLNLQQVAADTGEEADLSTDCEIFDQRMTTPRLPPATFRAVMPVHNGGRYLRAAVLSVLADLGDGELIAIDDGSSDGSWDVLSSIAEHDRRVVLGRHTRPMGVSEALNRAVRVDRCPPYVAVTEHDDLVLRGRFSRQVEYLERNPTVGVVASEGRYIGPTDTTWGRVSVGPRSVQELEEMKRDGLSILVPHPSAMFRLIALEQAGYYDSAFDGSQDLDLINRIVYRGQWAAITLRECHVLYRIHSSATSFERFAAQRMMMRFIRERNRAWCSGKEFGDYQGWLESHNHRSWQRLTWKRHDIGALLFRRAGLNWMAGRRLHCALILPTAAILHPGWVLRKVIHQVRPK